MGFRENREKYGTTIVDTIDSYKIIEKVGQEAEDSKSGYRTFFGSVLLVIIVMLLTSFCILYFFASTTIIDCEQTSKANPDAHINAVVSCQVTRQYLLKPEKQILPLTPVQSVRLAEGDDTCRVELTTPSGHEMPLTVHYSSMQCSLGEEVDTLNRFIETHASQQVTREAQEKGGFSFGGYFLPVGTSLLIFLAIIHSTFNMFKTGLMTRIEFDKRAYIMTIHYITPLKTYDVSYHFNDVIDVYLEINEDEEDGDKIDKHLIKTKDKKIYKIKMPMTVERAKIVNKKIRQILDLPMQSG